MIACLNFCENSTLLVTKYCKTEKNYKIAANFKILAILWASSHPKWWQIILPIKLQNQQILLLSKTNLV